MDLSMAEIFFKGLMQHGPFVVAVFLGAWYVTKVMIPAQQKREAARDALLEAWMTRYAAAADAAMEKQLAREDKLIQAHEQAIREQETRHYKDRNETLLAFREMMDKSVGAITESNTLIRQNIALAFTLGERLQIPRKELADGANRISDKPINVKDYETKERL